MTDLTPNLTALPPLSDEAQDDARFRVRDRLWAAIGDLYDQYREEQGLSYAGLARRIGRTRAQVQRWLSAPVNMTSESAGLLSEGLDADLDVVVRPRLVRRGQNRAHPCEEARASVVYAQTAELNTRRSVDYISESDMATADSSAVRKIEIFEKVYAQS